MNIEKLKEAKAKIEKEIKVLEKRKAIDSLNQSEFKELRECYEKLQEAVIEKKTVYVELSINIECTPNDSYDIFEDDMLVLNDISIKKTNDNRVAFVVQELLLEMDDPLFDEPSKASKAEYNKKMIQTRKRFQEVAKAKGVCVKDLNDLIVNSESLRAAKKVEAKRNER